MNVSSVLDGAADLIERDGWCRYDFTDANGAHCLYGALQCVGCVAHPRAVIFRALGIDSLFNWNDAPERTKEEVIAMLRAVAATERAREASPVRVVAETQDALPESVRS